MLAKEDIIRRDEELLKQYGFIFAREESHKNRIHIKGFRAASGPYVRVHTDEESNLYLVVYLDPLSPIGQIIGRWIIPFSPYPKFHLDDASLHIYAIDEEHLRIEVRAASKRRRSKDQSEYEYVFGVQIKLEDGHHLYPVK